MNVLVVFCHPTHESFAGAALDRVLTGLAATRHEVRTIDLYAEGFTPELSVDERAAHLVDHRTAPGIRVDVAEHLELVRWATALVFVYPTWWSGQPAMLKGWLDRVLVNGVAWTLPEGANRIRPMLTHLRRLVVVTSHGSTKFVNALEGEGGKRVITRAVRVLCSRRCRTSWIAIYDIDRAPAERRAAFLDRVERRLSRL